MAGKFFNQKVKGSSNRSMKAYLIVGGCILVIFITVILIVSIDGGGSANTPDPIIEMQDRVLVEINGEIPDVSAFFRELQNVSSDDISPDFSGVNLTQIGTYNVNIEINGTNYRSSIEVVDTTAPMLATRDVTINVGESYDAEDFVTSCIDNSNESCEVAFYESGLDQDGNTINYSSYTAEGSYTIQIVASDSSGNVTPAQSVTLTIGDGGNTGTPTTCRYGGSEYDSNTYILGVNLAAANNGCALDLNLYQDPGIQKAARDLADADTQKLQREVYNINVDREIPRNLDININPVLNTTGNGLVGYTVEMVLSLQYSDGTEEVIAQYYLDTDGNRVYSINKYNLE